VNAVEFGRLPELGTLGGTCWPERGPLQDRSEFAASDEAFVGGAGRRFEFAGGDEAFTDGGDRSEFAVSGGA